MKQPGRSSWDAARMQLGCSTWDAAGMQQLGCSWDAAWMRLECSSWDTTGGTTSDVCCALRSRVAQNCCCAAPGYACAVQAHNCDGAACCCHHAECLLRHAAHARRRTHAARPLRHARPLPCSTPAEARGLPPVQVIGVGFAVLGDMSSRPNWGLSELDFVFSTLMVRWCGCKRGNGQ
eukprot:366156-Chlamydomonas_euryale.AAC.7